MKRYAIPLLFTVMFSPALFAQSEINHGEVGVFADYFRVRGPLSANLWGAGARVSINATKRVQLEGELNYDFSQPFNESFNDVINGRTFFATEGMRAIHGLFGPKFQTGAGPWRAFVTVKGGFVNFRFDDRPVTFATFGSSIDELRSDDMSGVLYPGGGVEMYLGPVGLRLDVGDEIFYTGKPHHNLRMSFGPNIRF
jgi:hypothetical protein